ncbi:hypothetical protein ACLBKU_11000 [Erythrobacter sp. NE805]|uniref:hypothetical protein n=1 Tax=Erythrobacter sp. NE805 TaxID=3389875 RepID=UPI00396B041F
MSVRFASANHPVRRLGWRAAGRGLIAPALARAANDNLRAGVVAATQGVLFDPLLSDALRHFAVHGLAAAEAAVELAAEARSRDDADARDHWLAVVRMFDRRMAARFDCDLLPG